MTDGSLLPESLVSTDWLSVHLGHRALRVVDIRGYVKSQPVGHGKQIATYTGAPEEYAAGHIHGAVFVDWTRDIVDPDAKVAVQIAPPALFAAAMEQRGIGDDTSVVIADHTGGHFATRLWWALKYYGHDQVAILDGGYVKWIAEGRTLDTALPVVERHIFTPVERPTLRVEVDEVLASIDQQDVQIVDARDDETYRGDVYRGSRRGHLPGALNVAAKSLYRSDGTWMSREELAERLSQSGIDPGSRVISYCNGGVTATAVLFALDRIGHSSFTNYDGSWNEWGERVDLPVESDHS